MRKRWAAKFFSGTAEHFRRKGISVSRRSPTRTNLAAPKAAETSARESENRLEAMKRVVLLREENLADFFDLLLRVDKRNNPGIYDSNNQTND